MKSSFQQYSGSPVLCVAGARPNFMKIAPIMSELQAGPDAIPVKLVHTGQHYDADMNDTFFTQLKIPSPDISLEVGSGSHAYQTAEIMRRFEPVVDAESPAAVLVVGDVNSTIACALVAAKKNIPIIHVEAGLRSFDRTMPEEVNRVLTDQLSDVLFTTEPSARENLLREGIAAHRIFHVGNVMIDTLRGFQSLAVPAENTLAELDNKDQFLKGDAGYCVLTLHRPSNVDDPALFRHILETVRMVSEDVPVIFPIHPRTRNRVIELGLQKMIESPRIAQLKPLGYLQMLGLVSDCRLVMTDSGGLQEETTVLGVPCITLRDNTERPVTVDQGTNAVVGHDRQQIMSIVADVLRNGGKQGRTPELWDGQAAVRIKSVLTDWLRQRQQQPAIANG
jgi:UDP-N-acetylglucosamine 2-epimerase (non-hydrolysing)